MTHVIEGWIHHSSLKTPVSTGATQVVGSNKSNLAQTPRLWKYRTLKASRGVMGLAVMISIGLHLIALMAFNGRPAPVKVVALDDDLMIRMEMPDLLEEELEPVESLNDEEAMEDPGIIVPMLMDLPTIVPVNAFVQPLEFTPSLPDKMEGVSLSAVPVNIARGSVTAKNIGQIFDISQLDRQPQAILQPAPLFPRELKKEFPECTVVMGFIISSKGEVLSPYVISSEVRRFEEAAIKGVLRWKFRPGYKGGRPVNTRAQIVIKFRVVEDD